MNIEPPERPKRVSVSDIGMGVFIGLWTFTLSVAVVGGVIVLAVLRARHHA